MYVEVNKLVLSLLISAMVLVFGGMLIADEEPSLRMPDYSLTSEELIIDDEQQAKLEDGSELPSDATPEHKQNAQKNAKMEVEVMTASIETVNATNSSDWSLENLSDYALEIE